MKILDNKNNKLLLLLSISVVILSIVIFTSIFIYLNNTYTKRLNNIISNVIVTIQEKYPDIKEEEILEILNQDSLSSNTDILEKYGIVDEISSIYITQKHNSITVYILIFSIVFSNGLILIFISYYLKYRKKKISEFITYIDNISNNNYMLEIDKNTEDELTSLKNELYKLTVMLKERTDDSIKQKEYVYKLVSDISHQLKTPLTSIQILLDNINENKDMDPKIKDKFIFEISRKVESMNWLIISLLKLSKLDAQAVEFKNENINLKEIISDIVDELSIMAEVKNIDINVICKDDIYINADYNWNKEAIKNIVKNAIEHAKTSITITVSENKVYVEITVLDDGIGIEKNELGHIFDRFYKSKNSDENSIGIGLCLSKSIIEKQNGYISVESSKNQYTKFIIKYIKN